MGGAAEILAAQLLGKNNTGSTANATMMIEALEMPIKQSKHRRNGSF